MRCVLESKDALESLGIPNHIGIRENKIADRLLPGIYMVSASPESIIVYSRCLDYGQ